MKPIVVDPGLYLAEESEVYYATQKRELPDAYRLFTGEDADDHFICNNSYCNVGIVLFAFFCLVIEGKK